MSRAVLAQVLTPVTDNRGPDGKLKVRLPGQWLEEGAEIELQLPRNILCAQCEGGGCDRCERSGAISLRGRKEPAELVLVTLPKMAESRDVTLRLPGHGGLPSGDEEARGVLLLVVQEAAEPDSWVRRIEEPEQASLLPQSLAALDPPVLKWVGLVVVMVGLALAWLLGSR